MNLKDPANQLTEAKRLMDAVVATQRACNATDVAVTRALADAHEAEKNLKNAQAELASFLEFLARTTS